MPAIKCFLRPHWQHRHMCSQSVWCASFSSSPSSFLYLHVASVLITLKQNKLNQNKNHLHMTGDPYFLFIRLLTRFDITLDLLCNCVIELLGYTCFSYCIVVWAPLAVGYISLVGHVLGISHSKCEIIEAALAVYPRIQRTVTLEKMITC